MRRSQVALMLFLAPLAACTSPGDQGGRLGNDLPSLRVSQPSSGSHTLALGDDVGTAVFQTKDARIARGVYRGPVFASVPDQGK